MEKRLHVLGFEPFDGGSHRAVREAITHHSRHEWSWFTRPARAWKWRMRLAALDLVAEAEAAGALAAPVDALFATSLLSVSDLVASLPAGRRGTPVILYMHENQAAYPAPEGAGAPERDVHFALTNLASIRCADLTIWNSAWNRRSFEEGIRAVLRRAPEGALRAAPPAGTGIVIWPPVEPPPVPRDRPGVLQKPIRVVWPHRWEHDKGPEELLAVARRWTGPLDLRWTILGERFRQVPPALRQFEREFGDRIDAFGYEPQREAYWEHLRGCDWVLSTARHEFFGIAVVEALLAGCLPWLPPRLSYPELLPAAARGLAPDVPPPDVPSVRRAIASHLAPAIAPHAVALLDDALAAVSAR